MREHQHPHVKRPRVHTAEHANSFILPLTPVDGRVERRLPCDSPDKEPVHIILTPFNPLASVRAGGQYRVNASVIGCMFEPLEVIAADSSALPDWWLQAYRMR